MSEELNETLELLRPCTFEQGEKVVIDLAVLEECVRNFKPPVAVSVDFAIERDVVGDIPGPGAPAVGWVQNIGVRNGSLWAEVQWVKAKPPHAYIAAAIRIASRDSVTGAPIGATLTSAGVVDREPLDGHGPMPGRLAVPAVPAEPKL